MGMGHRRRLQKATLTAATSSSVGKKVVADRHICLMVDQVVTFSANTTRIGMSSNLLSLSTDS